MKVPPVSVRGEGGDVVRAPRDGCEKGVTRKSGMSESGGGWGVHGSQRRLAALNYRARRLEEVVSRSCRSVAADRC